MSFKFNFGESSSTDGSSDTKCDVPCEKEESSQNPLRPCQVHECDLKKEFVNFEWSAIDIGKHSLRFVSPDFAATNVSNDDITSLITSSDLRSGEYEGGLKVWECTFDLLDYLEDNNIAFQANTVLDMGCGAGLLGIFAFLKGASSVCFQDYNCEVIESFTIPSLCASLSNAHIDPPQNEGRLKLMSGDWGAVGKHLKAENSPLFDLILSSETIYNVEYYQKILEFLRDHLSDKGEALFAAKTHYFGVGGGTYDFVNFVSKSGIFDVSVVKKIEHGLTREILKVFKKKVS